MESYAIVSSPSAYMYEVPGEDRNDLENGGMKTAIADEVFHGTPVKIVLDAGEYVKAVTPYGYAGYIFCDNMIFTSDKRDIEGFLSDNLHMVTAKSADVLSRPTVKGCIMMTLPYGSLVPVVDDKDNQFPGWTRVVTLTEGEGYIATSHLGKKIFGEDFLWEDEDISLARLKKAAERSPDEKGGNGFDFKAFLNEHYDGDEDYFRSQLTSTALRFLETQYRWGARGFNGIDCSGLVFTAYHTCGVSIYRDAALAEGFALRKIEEAVPETGVVNEDAMLPGDTIYFPGHVAMYLGEGMYIHSTAKAGSDGVVINSFRPGDDDYREDLHKQIYAVGGLR